MTIYTADDLDRMAEYADMRTSLRPYCDISAALRQAARMERFSKPRADVTLRYLLMQATTCWMRFAIERF